MLASLVGPFKIVQAKKRNGSTYDEGSIAEINLEKKRVWIVVAKICPN